VSAKVIEGHLESNLVSHYEVSLLLLLLRVGAARAAIVVGVG